ncbi:hypothetical protein EV126DRAFT_28176 [Verticillium dahliae]|nr:hypothetical protein EV126DRAFT_28176 [Verticillium dahliae]
MADQKNIRPPKTATTSHQPRLTPPPKPAPSRNPGPKSRKHSSRYPGGVFSWLILLRQPPEPTFPIFYSQNAWRYCPCSSSRIHHVFHDVVATRDALTSLSMGQGRRIRLPPQWRNQEEDEETPRRLSSCFTDMQRITCPTEHTEEPTNLAFAFSGEWPAPSCKWAGRRLGDKAREITRLRHMVPEEGCGAAAAAAAVGVAGRNGVVRHAPVKHPAFCMRAHSSS